MENTMTQTVGEQSAVEWLVEQIKDVKYNPLEINGYSNALEKLFKQAKEMENEQQGYSEELIQLELLIKSQEELKDQGVLNNEGIGYLNGLKTALKHLKKK